MTLNIPKFLDRRNDDTKNWLTTKKQDTTGLSVPNDQSKFKTVSVEYGKHKLTGKFKENLAVLIMAEVSKGNNTFGKIRKALGDRYSDNELKSGLNQAKKWNKTLALKRIAYWKLTMNGKTYSIENQ